MTRRRNSGSGEGNEKEGDRDCKNGVAHRWRFANGRVVAFVVSRSTPAASVASAALAAAAMAAVMAVAVAAVAVAAVAAYCDSTTVRSWGKRREAGKSGRRGFQGPICL